MRVMIMAGPTDRLAAALATQCWALPGGATSYVEAQRTKAGQVQIGDGVLFWDTSRSLLALPCFVTSRPDPRRFRCVWWPAKTWICRFGIRSLVDRLVDFAPLVPVMDPPRLHARIAFKLKKASYKRNRSQAAPPQSCVIREVRKPA